MGNCLHLQQKPVCSVMKTDGKIIEYRAPIKVRQVLSEFSHDHAISDRLPVANHLHPRRTEKAKKTVRFAEDLVKLEEERESGAVRIKFVISKKELQAMLAEEGVSVEDMISRMQKVRTQLD